MVQTYLDIQEAFTKKAENCVLVGYVHGDNTPTWGWGHTGPEVKVGQSITPAEAETYFKVDQALADHRMKERCTAEALAKLDEHEKAALLDFVFNAGANPDWTIWKVVNGTEAGSVPDQFDRFIWVHPGPGKPAVTSAGLKNRRAAEKALWNTADVNVAITVATAGGNTASSAMTEQVTPPTPDAPKALAKTSLGLKVSALFASGGGLLAKNLTPDTQSQVQNVHDTVVAHASELGKFGHLATNVAGAAVVAIAAGALMVHVTQQEAAKK